MNAAAMATKKYLHRYGRIALPQKFLQKKGYTLESVPAKGELVLVKPTANLSTGGTSADVTEEVHPSNIFYGRKDK